MEIRKVERRTIWEATEPVQLDPESFSKLSEKPYLGNHDDESEFLSYIQDLYWEDFYEISAELESLGFEDDADAIIGLFEGDMEVYSDTSTKGEDSWFEVGETDEEYRKTGGFNSRHDTMS